MFYTNAHVMLSVGENKEKKTARSVMRVEPRLLRYKAAITAAGAIAGLSIATNGLVQSKSEAGEAFESIVELASEPKAPRPSIEQIHEPMANHADQLSLIGLTVTESREGAFHAIFEIGDELFDTDFNSLDGGGANIGNGMSFSRVPRADLKGPTEWANHMPFRHTGPNAQSCTACHNQPFEDGAGSAAMNVVRDPTASGRVDKFIIRNTPHLFGIGALQRLAEEMTTDLHTTLADTIQSAKQTNVSVTKMLITKGISFGKIKALPNGDVDYTEIVGLDDDLIVKPLQWKGTDKTLREFTRNAAHRELGIQPIELVGEDVDGDFDGVVNEMTVGDITAMTLYLAGQPRPTTKLELTELGLIEPLSVEETSDIFFGERIFEKVGCASCHRPSLNLQDPVFSEPSRSKHFRDGIFPDGNAAAAHFVVPGHPIRFDLTKDLPDNVIERHDGSTIGFGNFETEEKGGAIVRLFGDLKRHDLGADLAEHVDEEGTGASVFMTAELWGVGDTAPYLHDGRAMTLADAILAHGGDAAMSRRAFANLPLQKQKSLIAFLNNLVLFKMEEEEEEGDAELASIE